MRKTFFLCLLLPLFSAAQINRSARELAIERIDDYIQQKLFKLQPYKSVTYGELKPYQDARKEIFWLMDHRFDILETKYEMDKKTTKAKTYNFCFYLDDKMKVKKADTYFVSGSDSN